MTPIREASVRRLRELGTLKAVPTLNNWARTAGRPTLPTFTGRRRASRMARRAHERMVKRDALATMREYARISAPSPHCLVRSCWCYAVA